jgi:hypothetical protein
MKLRTLGKAGLFLMGCAVGGGASAFVVPKASAQQAATLTKWEYRRIHIWSGDSADITKRLNEFGAESWGLVTGDGQDYCFKRPRM